MRYAVTLLVNLKVGVNEFLTRGQKFLGPFEELPVSVQQIITEQNLKVATVTELPDVSETEESASLNENDFNPLSEEEQATAIMEAANAVNEDLPAEVLSSAVETEEAAEAIEDPPGAAKKGTGGRLQRNKNK